MLLCWRFVRLRLLSARCSLFVLFVLAVVADLARASHPFSTLHPCPFGERLLRLLDAAGHAAPGVERHSASSPVAAGGRQPADAVGVSESRKLLWN